jgi:hypothetical protein
MLLLAVQYEQQHAAPTDKQAAKELDFLAHLVHVAKPAAGDNFKLNLFLDNDLLFDEPAEQGTASKSSSSRPGAAKQQHNEMEFGSGGRNEVYIKAARLGDVLEQVQLEDAEDKGSRAIGDELLDLMDSVQ